MHVQRWHINMAHEDNLSMTEEIQVWRMPPSLRGSVGDLQLWAIILHKKVQEDPSTPLQKPQEEVEDTRREVGPSLLPPPRLLRGPPCGGSGAS
jgi:hypothetical protein